MLPRDSNLWQQVCGASRIGASFSPFCPPPTLFAQPKLLSHFGHENVSILILDSPQGRSASPLLARTTIRRFTGAPSLGDIPPDLRSPHCPQCGLLSCSPESLECHVARCPNGGARYLMHHGLIKSRRFVVEEAGVPKAAIVEEAQGLREGGATRP